MLERGGRVTDDSADLASTVAVVVDRIMGSKSGRASLVKRHRDLLITDVFTPEAPRRAWIVCIALR